MTIKAIQIRDIRTITTSLPAVATSMTRALPVVPTLQTSWVAAGPNGTGPECLAMTNPCCDSSGGLLDPAA